VLQNLICSDALKKCYNHCVTTGHFSCSDTYNLWVSKQNERSIDNHIQAVKHKNSTNCVNDTLSPECASVFHYKTSKQNRFHKEKYKTNHLLCFSKMFIILWIKSYHKLTPHALVKASTSLCRSSTYIQYLLRRDFTFGWRWYFCAKMHETTLNCIVPATFLLASK
jgi:hypothetical protein